jgi:hypothetical protein
MAVNRYDNPAQLDFINTYVPIPFEQLMTLGRQQKADIDQAMKDYGDAKKLWSEFNSESQVDMNTWDAATMGKVRPIINEFAKNPDKIKTAEGRMQLQMAINSVDTGLLGRLKQSAANFELRKAAIQKLMLEGKYNPNWHDRDMTNWDSTKQGVFKDINVTPYTSVNDLIDPYVNDLKPSYMGTKGGYDWHGVSEGRTREQVEQNMTEIQNTPAGREHIAALIRQGLSPEDAVKQFQTAVYRAAKEKAWSDIKGANEYQLLAAKTKAALDVAKAKGKKGKGSNNEDEPNPDVYSQSFATADAQQRSKLANEPAFASVNSGKYQAVIAQIANEVAAYQKAYKDGSISAGEYNAAMKDYETQAKVARESLYDIPAALQTIFREATGIRATADISKSGLSNKDYIEGASRVMDKLFTPADGNVENNYYKQTYNNEVEVKVGGISGVKGYVAPSTKGIILNVELANKAMGVPTSSLNLKSKDTSDRALERNFVEDFKNGRFKNVIVIPQNAHMVGEGVDGNSSIFSNTSVIISKTAIKEAGYDTEEFDKMYKSSFGEPISYGNASNQLEIKGAITAAAASNKDFGLSGETYYVFDASKEIPSVGRERMAYNQAGNAADAGNTLAKQEYPSNIDQSFSEEEFQAAMNMLN